MPPFFAVQSLISKRQSYELEHASKVKRCAASSLSSPVLTNPANPVRLFPPILKHRQGLLRRSGRDPQVSGISRMEVSRSCGGVECLFKFPNDAKDFIEGGDIAKEHFRSHRRVVSPPS